MRKNNKDHEYLIVLRDYYAQHGILPSFRTIANLIGLRSSAAIATMADRLKEKGYLESSSDRARRLMPGPRFFDGSAIQTEHAIVTVLAPLSNEETRELERAIQQTVTEFMASRQANLAKAA